MTYRAIALAERVQLLQTIPGVGRKTAEVVVAYVDDPHRFQNARQVSSYAGLVPKRYQSGVTVLGIWLGYQLNWIRQRRDIISDPQVQCACCNETLKIEIVGNVKRPRKRRTSVAAPRPLSWFGEFGYAEIDLGKGNPAGELARVRSLFPEAQVMGDD